MEDVRAFGRPFQAMVEWVGDLGFFCWRVAKAIFSRPFEGAEFLRQLDAIGAKSLPLVALAGAATGVVLSLQTRDSLTRFGAKSLLPAVIVFSLIKETGPIITGLIASGRVGAGIGAELGSMRVTEQIDAMEASAVDPHKYLAATRVLACIVAMPLLTLGGRFLRYSHGLGGFHSCGARVLEAVSFQRPSRRHIQRHSSPHLEDRYFRLDHRSRLLLSRHAEPRRYRRSGPFRHQLGCALVLVHHRGGYPAGSIDSGVRFKWNRQTNSEPPIAVAGLRKSFGKQTVLDGITFQLVVRPGDLRPGAERHG